MFHQFLNIEDVSQELDWIMIKLLRAYRPDAAFLTYFTKYFRYKTWVLLERQYKKANNWHQAKMQALENTNPSIEYDYIALMTLHDATLYEKAIIFNLLNGEQPETMCNFMVISKTQIYYDLADLRRKLEYGYDS